MGKKSTSMPTTDCKVTLHGTKTTMENIIFTHSLINLCRTNVFHSLVFCRLSWTSLWDLPTPTSSATPLPTCSFCPSKGGFPGGSDDKESTYNAGDLGSIPGLGRYPGGGHGNPLQSSCLKNAYGQRSLAGYSPWGHKVHVSKSQT